VRRADRLFQIIQRLRRRRTVTAAQLAEGLGVTVRTVYRDVRDLTASGVPIRGEAGVGYALQRGFDMPPLMLDENEVEALVLGARVVRGFADAGLAAAAEDLLAKVEAVLPAHLRQRVSESALHALNFHESPTERATLGALRGAIRAQRKVAFAYQDRKSAASRRTVRPLGLFYLGPVWQLGAWCELRQDFRNFRLDRLTELEVTPERFEVERGRTLPDLFEHYRREAEREGAAKGR
jgi:predicted DNA-binding transcriptional regulator YafY